MEYGDAITPQSAEQALKIAREKMAAGRQDLRKVATEAVAEAYCVCVVAGEDAVEGGTAAIHAQLIEDLELSLRIGVNHQAKS